MTFLTSFFEDLTQNQIEKLETLEVNLLMLDYTFQYSALSVTFNILKDSKTKLSIYKKERKYFVLTYENNSWQYMTVDKIINLISKY